MFRLRTLAALVLLCTAAPAWATSKRPYWEVPMTLFPMGIVPLNALFWLPVTKKSELPLHYKNQRARLVDDSGAVVPTRNRRMPFGNKALIQLRPLADLEPSRRYCIKLVTLTRGKESDLEHCVRTGTSRDDAPPTGGVVRALTLWGTYWLYVDFDAGHDASQVGLEVDMRSSRFGTARCRHMVLHATVNFRNGVTLDLESSSETDGARCLRDLESLERTISTPARQLAGRSRVPHSTRSHRSYT